jgi:hypothetical protein
MSFDPMGYPHFTETADGQKDAIIAAQKIHGEGQSAEIERLEKMYVEMFGFREEEQIKNYELKALVTKLADRLEKIDHNWPNEDYGIDAELIQRAREATK